MVDESYKAPETLGRKVTCRVDHVEPMTNSPLSVNDHVQTIGAFIHFNAKMIQIN